MVSGWSMELGPILHYGVYVLIGIVCVGAIVRALWAPMDIHRAPCCGGCGHGVRDILQGVCPECGGQYAKVGITTPSMAVRLRASLPIALLAWTTMVGVGASLSHGWLEQRAWATYSTASVAFTPGVGGKQSEKYTTDLTPVSMGSFSAFGRAESKTALEYRISLDLGYVIDGDKVESGMCVMKLRKNGEPESFPLTIDLADGSFTIKDDQGKEIAKGGKDSKVDDGVVEQWFDHAGLDIKDKAVRRSIKDAAKIARYARVDPGAIEASLNNSFSTGDDGALRGNGGSRSSGPGAFGATAGMVGPPGIGTMEMSIWVGMLGAVYVSGCAGIVWRNRRVLRG